MRKIIVSLSLLVSICTNANTEIYGFFLGSYQKAEKSFDLDHRPTFVNDMTAATALQSEERSQFNYSKTRVGTRWSDNDLSGKIEFDFDGGSSNGVTAGGELRIRLAQMNYSPIGGGKLTAGKKWTMFKGLTPHTYAVTTINFNAGNTGFLVDGVDYTQKLGDWVAGIEFANIGDENTAKVSSPITTAMFNYKSYSLLVGSSYTMATLKQATLDPALNADSKASGLKVYSSFKPIDKFELRVEYFLGENLGSIHTGGLASAFATDAKKYESSGFFASAKFIIGESLGVFGNYGQSEFATASEAGISSMNANSRMGFGIDYKLEQKLTTFFEWASFTTSWNQAVATTTLDSDATMLEVGLKYNI